MSPSYGAWVETNMSKHNNGTDVQPDNPEAGDGQEKREENPEAIQGNAVPGNAAPGPDNKASVTPEEKIAELEARLAESNDQLLR